MVVFVAYPHTVVYIGTINTNCWSLVALHNSYDATEQLNM